MNESTFYQKYKVHRKCFKSPMFNYIALPLFLPKNYRCAPEDILFAMAKSLRVDVNWESSATNKDVQDLILSSDALQFVVSMVQEFESDVDQVRKA